MPRTLAKFTLDRAAEKRLLARFQEPAVKRTLDLAASKGAQSAAQVKSRAPIGLRVGSSGLLLITPRTGAKRWVRQVYRVMDKALAAASAAVLEAYGRG